MRRLGRGRRVHAQRGVSGRAMRLARSPHRRAREAHVPHASPLPAPYPPPTRPRSYMLAACRTSCERQRASAHEALLDTDLDCASWADEGGCGRAAIDVAAAAAAASHARADGDGGASEDARKLQRCAGSCAGLDLCAAAGLRNGTAADAAHAAGNGADGGGAAAAEWRVCVDALRCQELLDREPSCAQRAARGECASEPGLLLSRCFLR